MERCLAALKEAEAGDCVAALKVYVEENGQKFHFDERIDVVTDFVSGILRYAASESATSDGRQLALNALRILTRQKSGFGDVLTAAGTERLLRFAGVGSEQGEADTPVVVEALKCLCNLTYQFHDLAPIVVAVDGALAHLLKSIGDATADHNVRFFSARLVFLLSAVFPACRSDVQKAKGLRSLCDGVLAALGMTHTDAGLVCDSSMVDGLLEKDADLAGEVMKCVFNISMEAAKMEATPEELQAVVDLVQVARVLLSSFALMERKDVVTLRSQVTNMLINLPASCANHFTPRSHAQYSTDKVIVFEHRDITAAHHLLHQMDTVTKDLDGAAITTARGDSIVPLVTAMANCSRACGPARRYWRSRILPTLRAVVSRPDEGDSLKARLVRLMTSSHTTLASTVADFLFVLCKENAGRLVKYTGYGNAAGLLLQRGLLSGGSGTQTAQYSSDSSDSDTEEYRESKVNVMTGGPEPENQPDPLAGMTEEEKEAEAEKLGELMNKLESTGVMKVMRRGDAAPKPDGSS